jgi:hypothetical protein
VAVETAETINVTYDSVTVPAGGGAPTVVVRLSNDLGFGLTGLPAANLRFTLAQLTAGQNGGSSEWQSYITQDSAGIPDAQATTETATAGTYTDNGDGTYTYTFSQDLTAYPAGPTYDETRRSVPAPRNSCPTTSRRTTRPTISCPPVARLSKRA